MQTQLQRIESLLDLAEKRGLHSIGNEAAQIFNRMRDVFAMVGDHAPLYSWAELTPASRYALRRVPKPADMAEPRFFVHYGTHYDIRDFEFATPGGYSTAVGGIVLQRRENNIVAVFPAVAGVRPSQQPLL